MVWTSPESPLPSSTRFLLALGEGDLDRTCLGGKEIMTGLLSAPASSKWRRVNSIYAAIEFSIYGRGKEKGVCKLIPQIQLGFLVSAGIFKLTYWTFLQQLESSLLW